MDNFCCVDNDSILNNQNYPHSFYNKTIDDRNYTFRKSGKEKIPSSKMELGDLKPKSILLESISKIPISSIDVIIGKRGDPYEDYKKISNLGEGTFGKVYKVKNKNNNSIRAMKKIAKHWVNELNDNEVEKEIDILKDLNHPYIIKLYEYYVNDKYIFLIHELCEEGDLQGKIKKIGKFPEFIVKVIMLQIFKALMYLNEKNIIHGDLKLENILVYSYENNDNKDNDGFIEAIKHDMDIINGSFNSISSLKNFKIDIKDIDNINRKLNEKHQREEINSYGTTFKLRGQKKKDKKINKSKNIYDSLNLHIFNYGIKLIDFGCSKIFTRTKKNFSDIIGTLLYCSPEVLANDYNESCDIWSCGVLMYCLISGYFPFDGDNETEITRKILTGKYEFDIDHFNGISDEAKDLISKCLKKEPRKRISIQEALNHRFFDDLKEIKKFTEEDKKKLKNLKNLSKYPKFYQLVLTYLSYNFSDNKLLNELSQLYDKLDDNSDYQITKAELYKAYKEAGIAISNEELDKIIKSLDFDNNGYIDYEEFIRMCIPKEKLFTEANLENAFLLFDKDKKGFITPSEITDFIQSNKNINEKTKKKIKKEILDIADEIIDYEEFKIFMLTI